MWLRINGAESVHICRLFGWNARGFYDHHRLSTRPRRGTHFFQRSKNPITPCIHNGFYSFSSQAKVVDNQGRTVPIGEKGELWTRSFGTMLGYWDDEVKTRETIRPDRWMPSGYEWSISEWFYLFPVPRRFIESFIGSSNDCLIYSRYIVRLSHQSIDWLIDWVFEWPM